MAYHLTSDEHLISMLRAGDQLAFREIYLRYWRSLFFAARKKIRSDAIAEEVVQNVFLSLWEKHKVLQVDNLGAYLFGSLKYQVIDHLRKQMVAAKHLSTISCNADQGVNTTDVIVNQQAITQIFEDVLNQLPEKTSKIFRLSRLEHKTTREISGLLKIPERTVEYHITLSLKLLRQQLADFLPIWAGMITTLDLLSLFK